MIERVFLGSGSPLLPAVASWVVDQHAETTVGMIDCRGHVVVLPTARAGRRLKTLLVKAAGDSGLVPPEVMTPAGLLGRFLVPDRTPADAMSVQMAWRSVFRSADADLLRSVTGYTTPPTDREALELASRMNLLFEELGAAAYTPESVRRAGLEAGLPLDVDRWKALDLLWSDVRDRLSAWNLVDLETARLRRLDSPDRFDDGVDRITMISADPSGVTRRLLDRLSDQGVRIHAIIHGPADSLRDDFDRFGSVDLTAWTTRSIDLRNATVSRCDRTDDQAAVILETLAEATEASGELVPEELTIVIPDDEAASETVRVLSEHDVPIPLTIGTALRDGRIGSLIRILADLLEDESAVIVGDLIRHPDLEALLEERGCASPVGTWDRLWSAYHPRSLDSLVPESPAGRVHQSLLDPIRELLEPFRQGSQPLAHWLFALMDFVSDILTPVQHTLREEDHEVVAILRELAEVQRDITAPETIDAASACRLIGNILPGRPRWVNEGGGVSVVGWLDAHLDDSPHLIITGLNEGILPEATTVDGWLPESLRDAIGLPSHRRRMARDSWLLHAILQSGREVTLVTAQRTSSGTPLAPSRLLLRTTGEELAHRVRTLVAPADDSPLLHDWLPRPDGPTSFLEDPLPVGDPVIDYVTVTSFRRFIDDPLAFLLERDQRIRAREVERSPSLDPAAFGSMVHGVLETWGREELNRPHRTEDPDRIESDLMIHLQDYARDHFGERPLPALRVQIAIAAHRLREVARVQSDRARKGWAIHQVELSFNRRNAPSFPDGTGLPLHGKIDRIDVDGDGNFQALDYKTGSSVEGPVETHRTGNRWKDLQLPLYQFLLASVGKVVPADGLGYFLVPPDRSACDIMLARWKEEDLEGAFERAADIVEILTGGGLISAVEENQ